LASFPETLQSLLSDESEAAKWRDSLKGIKNAVVKAEERAIVARLSFDQTQNS
jgi:hypothetical protein